MVFTSFNFLIFFPLSALIYWITPKKLRWLTLLATSYFFYLNIKPVYLLLVIGITLSTFLFTRLMDQTNIESKKKTYMIINIILILLPLFFFKYFSDINNGIINLLESKNIRWPLPEIQFFLPIGISFYTFIAIGYTIDIYNEELEPEKNIGILALFISFFPLILSGPIERAKNMIPQFKKQQKINTQALSQGLKMMLWGYFMKLVVADRLGMYVDAIFNNISHHNGTSFLFASVLYPFQVYADLGGYSFIAIGIAKVLGYNVMHNFKRPFFATSISQFWRRWHISLISWLTDYIYTPLSFAFRKYSVWGIVIALMITFFISGIWHGANLTFVIWGLMQGIFLGIEALTNKKKTIFKKEYDLNSKRWYIIIGIFTTFILFTSSQIFARAPNLDDALLIYDKIFTQPGTLFLDKTTLAYALTGLFILLTKDFIEEFRPGKYLLFNNKNIIVRFSSYLAVIFIILYIGVLTSNQFIYFQF